jgi:nucleoside-diphosphate-sugar epimerase
MRITITGGNLPLARATLAALPREARPRLVDTAFDPPPAGAEALAGDLCDPAFAEAAVAGADVVLHLAPLASSGDDLADVDGATRGTYQLFAAAAGAGVRRFVLGSSLALFDRLPDGWKVDERWRPRPTSSAADLRAWLSELCVRELARDLPLAALCLRFGAIVTDEHVANAPPDPRWLHVEDAAEAIARALGYDERGWSILHIAAGPRARPPLGVARDDLGFEPRHRFAELRPGQAAGGEPPSWPELLAPPEPIAPRPLRTVVIFGAGGPLASAAAAELAPAYTLRLTDLDPLDRIAARGQPQFPGAPLPAPPEPPHQALVVDVTDPEAVLAACAGADAIVNCSVIRRDPAEAFRVNTLGAYNIMRAAVAHGIARVVHTGPFQVAELGPTSYRWDYDVPDEAPPRPGAGHEWQLYFHSKRLGQEICRVFAESHGMTVPALLFVQFVNPQHPDRPHLYPFAVSWRDAARAIRAALEVSSLPSPFEVLHISADLPHGVFRFEKVRRLLGWEARDTLAALWREPDAER